MNVLCFSSFGQEPFFRTIDISGISSEVKILTLCEDNRKVIWMGTSDGLYMFNGLLFEQVELPDTLLGESITVVVPSGDNGIIGGTKKGLIFKASSDHVRIISSDSMDITSTISSIHIDNNSIWVATKGQGLYKIDNDSILHMTTADGLSDDYIYTLSIDDDNNLWVGTDRGIAYTSLTKNDNKFIGFDVSDGLPENIVRKIVKGPGNTIGIGMEEKGFCLFDYKTKTFFQNDFFKKWNEGPVSSMILLENEFWIGTQKWGITDYEFRGKNRIRKFFGSNEFAGTDINSMIKDHEGNVWIAAGNELYFSTGENIEFTRSINGVDLGNIRAILTDKDENIWFSNENGLFRYVLGNDDETELTRPLEGTIYEGFHVISMFQDEYGFIWIGTFDDGLLRYDPESNNILSVADSYGLMNLNILSIDGRNNEMWFATLGGVAKCNLTDSTLTGISRFSSFTEENGLGNNFIYNVFIDSGNNIWFATDGKGVTKYSDGKFTNYSTDSGLKSKIIYSIAEDDFGNMWFSSASDGLYRYDGNEFMNFTFKQGLSDLNISALVNDVNGNLVIINRKGIDILDPTNFQILTYGSEVGLTNINPDLNVFDVDENGDIYTGIQGGIVRLSFEKSASTKAPLIILDKVLCFLEPADTLNNHKFKYNRNHISFSYFAVWYSDPLKVNYQYKLSGYNENWISTSDRFVTFPNLSPGKYTFYVRSSANSNFDNVPIASYQFEIGLPFWNELWFVLLVILIILGGLYAYLIYRDKRVKSLEQLNRERIESQFEVLKNQVNPHFLFNSFNTLISIIESDKDVAVEYVIKMSDFFRSILAVREMDLIKLNEELELVQNYIFLQKKRYGDSFEVEVNIPEEVIDQSLIPPLSLQILLENCLKHNAVSQETPLKCEIYLDEYNSLVIKNNINKKVEKSASTGIGLQNVKNRYKILSGKRIDIREQDGFFIVRLPLIKIT